MRISIVIPALNEEKYLPKTLESIKHLSRQPDEILVIDGDSTDKTAAIALSYGAKVYKIPKTTIGAARQKGLEEATGDVIAFTDADTIVPKDWLEKIEKSLNKPGIVATYGCYTVVDGWLPYRMFINMLNPFFFWIAPLFNVYIVGGQNIAFWKNKAQEVGGFPVEFRSAEDYEMMRRLATIGKIHYRPDNKVLSSGRRGNEGLGLFRRVGMGFIRYFFTGKADTFDFPHMR